MKLKCRLCGKKFSRLQGFTGFVGICCFASPEDKVRLCRRCHQMSSAESKTFWLLTKEWLVLKGKQASKEIVEKAIGDLVKKEIFERQAMKNFINKPGNEN